MSVTIQAPYDLMQCTIVLPSPNLGDSVAPRIKTIIRNSMDGTIYSSVKTNNRLKFEWDFDVTNAKGREIMAFVEAYSTMFWRVYDWNEKCYRLMLITNPVQMTPVGRNSINIRLEFEGTEVV